MKSFLKHIQHLFVFVSAFLALVSCDKNHNSGIDFPGGTDVILPVMYFTVTGTVLDEDGNPLKDIQAAFEDADAVPGAIVRTNERGEFKIGPLAAEPAEYVILCFDDTDISDGYYARRQERVPLKQVKKGNGSWMKGEYTNAYPVVIYTKLEDPSNYDYYNSIDVFFNVYDEQSKDGVRKPISGVKVYEGSYYEGKTDAMGCFSYSASASMAVDVSHRLYTFEDPEGVYETLEQDIKFFRAKDGLDYWCKGVYANEVKDIYLKKK